MNVLIAHPDNPDGGGVTHYYRILRGKFNMPVQHFIVGRRSNKQALLARPLRTFVDYWKFSKCLRQADINLVHINPSLDIKSFVRDGAFALLARLHKKKVIVFFHGWQKSCEVFIERYLLWLFRLVFGKIDAFIVLSDEFKDTLKRWGVTQPIYKEVTAINEDELAGFDIQNALKKRQSSDKWRILFLSRVVRDKGIYETVEAFSILQAKYPIIELIVAGKSNELENVKSFVRNRRISNVEFVGYVSGEEKRRILEKSQVFCFPTHHGEGLPLSVVESMAFGLPVVTRLVGGLADFFKNEEHGLISESFDPNIFAALIERLLVDKKLYNKISLNNYQYAQSHFLASDAVLRLETIYKTVLSSNSKVK